MIVAGIMSGTSADGIDVALTRITGRQAVPTIRLIGHAAFPFPAKVRECILSSMNAAHARVADLARLNFLLGELYAEAVLETQKRFRRRAELIGCHGQTLFHQGEAKRFLGRKLAVTWQSGEGSILAARLGVPVVSDFRPADMAAGGKGAPLVPLLDFYLYGDARIGRVAQNIGGIANLTAIPAGAALRRVTAFDTGPGNMVIDAVTKKLFGKSFDRDGELAAQGHILDGVLRKYLRVPYFRRRPPKTAGREEFGREFAREFVHDSGRVDPHDVVATATALTARSIGDALRRFVLSRRGNFRELIVSGGGSQNTTLMAMLANEVQPLGLEIRSSDEFGIPSEAKEAAAFALLAYQTWNQRPGNVPSATGARKAAILGKISYA
jgi:anhydro-N-acetylmuramic acid kinase